MTATAQVPVTVYATSTCPWCDRVKEYLTKNGVPYVAKDVAQDYPAAMEMIKRSGQQGVPVITTDDEVIVGFDQPRLAKIVDMYGKAKRAPLGLMAADTEQYLAKHPEALARIPAGTKGVYVGALRPGSVAERSGIKSGDVIVAAAGKKIRSMAMLDQLIDTLDAGQKISVRYLSNGGEQKTDFQF